MSNLRIRLTATLIVLGISGLGIAAQAATYTAQYVFGDSLSDNGNLAELLTASGMYPAGGFPNPPSYQQSFTNGPVGVQLLANSFGLSLTPSLWVTGFHDPANLFGGSAFVAGTNYAVADATAQSQATGGEPGINLPQQIGAFSAYSNGVADPSALYVLFIGGNDVADATTQGTGSAAIGSAVQTELGAIQTLAGEGAQNFLVVNVPNVGNTPEFAQDDPSQAGTATALSQLYDTELANGVGALTLPAGDQLTLFNLYTYNVNLLANAGSLGITDTTDRCYINTPYSASTTAACGPGAANISQFAYWDRFHPTAKIQAQWAQGFAAALPAQTPEPSTLTLLGSGAACLFGVAKRRRSRV